MKECLLAFCLASFVFAGSDPSSSISSQRSAISDLADVFSDQNDVLDKIINLDKKIALELNFNSYLYENKVILRYDIKFKRGVYEKIFICNSDVLLVIIMKM